MITRWDRQETAEGFEAYDDLPERTLGYPEVFRRLRLGGPDIDRVLDFGCGPGKVAERIVQCFDASVVAVDASRPMLEIAKDRRPHPRVEYHYVPDAQLDFLPSASIDAAMSCFVFISIADLEVIRSIVTEVHRVLRPGARYAILDTNPDATGIDFATFRSGEPGRVYAPGEPREVILHTEESDFTIVDYYWPAETYASLLRQAGFTDIMAYRPRLEEGHSTTGVTLWRNEEHEAPFLVTVGMR
jgi:ubiquinone/menaquinone biosynthesis C-methylase UbiE